MDILLILGALLLFWLVIEVVMRLMPYRTGFYTSIPRAQIIQQQKKHAVKTTCGFGWVHLGWIADPADEHYRIELYTEGMWLPIGEASFGSYLSQAGGRLRVLALDKKGKVSRMLGEVEVFPLEGNPAVYKPEITGEWTRVFQPQMAGYYINDHTIYQDANGDWRLLGITSRTNGNYNAECYFASAVSGAFPPQEEMEEQPPLADFGELAWAPAVIQAKDSYHLFWSPHRLHQMSSQDGINWENHRVTMQAPYHRFFRDPMVLQVAEDQWLLFTTARGRFFSQVDIYQSFDLQGWQYIRTALRTSWGSERNSAFASTESPFVIPYRGRYYLSVTYNNGSTFLSGLLLLIKKWLQPATYNDTLVFQSDNPYDFGEYRGRRRSPSLVAVLSAHAPEWVHIAESDRWYLTTCGWPWASTLTAGEVAAAQLEWLPCGDAEKSI